MSGHRSLKASRSTVPPMAVLWGVGSVQSCRARLRWTCSRAVARGGGVKGHLDRLYQPGPRSMPNVNLVRPGAAASRAEWWMQEAFARTDTTDFASMCCCRLLRRAKGRCGNQLRAAHHPCGRRLPRRAGGDAETGPSASILRASSKRCCARPAKPVFPYRAVEEVFGERKRTTAGRDLDITGLSYALPCSVAGCRLWPRSGQRCYWRRTRLYRDGVFPTASGRARFCRCCLCRGCRAGRCALPDSSQYRPARPVAWHEPHRHCWPPL